MVLPHGGRDLIALFMYSTYTSKYSYRYGYFLIKIFRLSSRYLLMLCTLLWYSRVRKKCSNTFINFGTFFQGLRSYVFKGGTSINFWFPTVRKKILGLSTSILGATFISHPTFILGSRVHTVKNQFCTLKLSGVYGYLDRYYYSDM